MPDFGGETQGSIPAETWLKLGQHNVCNRNAFGALKTSPSRRTKKMENPAAEHDQYEVKLVFSLVHKNTGKTFLEHA